MKKIFLPLILTLCLSGRVFSQSVNLLGGEGWTETATVKWEPNESADSYNVYYAADGGSDVKIDDQLIRSYGDYYRADIPGLAAGTYTIKVAAVIEGSEGQKAELTGIAVTAHDRTGFAFSNGRVPGAYKADGTPKSGAVILYITENTKNSISLEVTGANTNPCVGLQTILEGFKKGKDTRPLIVRLVGQITDLNNMDKGDIVVENNNNASSYITIEGVGDDAVADGWGLRLKNASNIEVRNLGFMNCNSNEGDDLGLQQSNEYIWVHNCDLFYGDAGSDSDQAKGDGAMDCKKSTYVTFSYNHFWDSGKSCLLGLGESSTEGFYATYHHNWFDHSDSRHPRVRNFSVHVYNNYFDGNAKYGVGATEGSSVFVEGNYFRNCKYPMMISQQGTDIFYDSSGTFSGEDGGIIKAYNNYMVGQRRFIKYGDDAESNSSTQFDAYVASSRNEQVASSIVTVKGGHAYNNFDTNSSIMYGYSADSPEDAKDKAMEFAGRMYGGDFEWTFDNAVDDESYAVNQALKSALSNYATSLVSVQGDGEQPDTGGGDTGGGDTGGGDTGGGDTGGEVDAGDRVHNFTSSGLSSTFYTISGNLSDSKGTVAYNSQTLTQCLKIESSTSITFKAESACQLTLVFKSDFSGSFKINGDSYDAQNGIIQVSLSAGDYTLTKGDVAFLFFMRVDYATSIGSTERDELQLYPNPVQDLLNIGAAEQIENIEVFNMQGVLQSNIMVDGTNVNLSGLKSGYYLIRISTKDRCEVRKIVKI